MIRKPAKANRSGTLMAKGTALVAVAALALAGCGDTSKKYDGHTEHALERVIHPAMVRTARSLIDFISKNQNLRVSQSASETRAGFKAELTGSTNDALGNKENVDLEVEATGETPGGFVDPTKVIAIYIGDSNADGSKSYYSLYAPGATGDVGLGNAHTQGWSAQQSGEASTKIFPDGNPFLLDTSDPEHFTSDINLDPTNPVATAQTIASDLPVTIKSIELEFAG
jgi:hypothetical protein